MNGLSLFWDKYQDIEQLAELLKNNNICVGSSDTVLGLFAPLTLQGYQKLNEIKNRAGKSYIVLVGSLIQVENIAYLPKTPYLHTLLIDYWPGPLTVILKKRDTLRFFESENDTIAVRIPAHVGLLCLLRILDGVFSTSANKAGLPVALEIKDIDSDIQQSVVAAILDRDQKKNVVPSTIIDCSQERLTLIREGVVPFSELVKKGRKF
jgi:L-threonylcarbamoyladenylate synthase